MKNKAEAIKQAWVSEIGENMHNQIHIDIDRDGWCDEDRMHFEEDSDKEKFEFTDCGFFRPISLQGIETNNGWHRIDEVGLPNETDEDAQYHIVENGIIFTGVYFNDGCWFLGELKFNATHYQEIKKPQPPIY